MRTSNQGVGGMDRWVVNCSYTTTIKDIMLWFMALPIQTYRASLMKAEKRFTTQGGEVDLILHVDFALVGIDKCV